MLLTCACVFSLLVLDEMDSLDCKSQQVLYTMFEWPSLPNSKLILIGQFCCQLFAALRLAPFFCYVQVFTSPEIFLISAPNSHDMVGKSRKKSKIFVTVFPKKNDISRFLFAIHLWSCLHASVITTLNWWEFWCSGKLQIVHLQLTIQLWVWKCN